MGHRDVVVVGASAGGVEALTRFVGALPADLGACVLVVLHIPPNAASALAPILQRSGPLPAGAAVDGDRLGPGRVLVAPPNHHLAVRGDQVLLTRGPRENGHRPSIDVLFRTAARSLGNRVVAVVLSGSNDDGLAGAVAVQGNGGLVLVQDPDDALFATMPAAVLSGLEADGVADPAGLAHLVVKACDEQLDPAGDLVLPPDAAAQEVEVRVAYDDDEAVLQGRSGMRPSGFVCPDCGGSLFTVEQPGPDRYRCRIGHAWSAVGLAAQQDLAVESALSSAVRLMQERAELHERMAVQAGQDGRAASARHFEQAADEVRRSAAVIKAVLARVPTGDSLGSSPLGSGQRGSRRD